MSLGRMLGRGIAVCVGTVAGWASTVSIVAVPSGCAPCGEKHSEPAVASYVAVEAQEPHLVGAVVSVVHDEGTDEWRFVVAYEKDGVPHEATLRWWGTRLRTTSSACPPTLHPTKKMKWLPTEMSRVGESMRRSLGALTTAAAVGAMLSVASNVAAFQCDDGFVNGHYAVELTSVVADGVTVEPGAEAFEVWNQTGVAYVQSTSDRADPDPLRLGPLLVLEPR